MSEWKKYLRTAIAEMRPVRASEDAVALSVHGISISQPDLNAGSPRPGDMIARNPKNHADQWLVAAKYFADNFEPYGGTMSDETRDPETFPYPREVGRTHWDGCWQERGHHNCAVAEVRRLREALEWLCPADEGFTEAFDELIERGLLVEVPADDEYRAEWETETMYVWAWNPLADGVLSRVEVDGRVMVVEALSGGWMVLVDGVQWGPVGEERNAAGAASSEWPSEAEARAAYER